MYDFKAPPEWAQRKRAMQEERRAKAKRARQNAETKQHLAAVERQEAARMQRLNKMPRITRPADEAAGGADT